MKAMMKVGQVGVGGFGSRRREIMRESGLFDLVAAYDLDVEALERCRAEDGAEPVESYQALLETPGLEAMVVSTGAKFHAEQVIAAARRGLHVFVEKPLCSTPEELDALLAVHAETGVVIGMGHIDHTQDPTACRIKELIDVGELGAIVAFEKTAAHSGGFKIQPEDWRGDPGRNPGGMLFQCGVHGLHELMHYFGRVVEVSCMMRHDIHATDTADAAVCHLRFASGLIGTLNAYRVTPYRHTLSILGTQANHLYRDDRYYDEGTHLHIQRVDRCNRKEPKEPVEVDETRADDAGGMRSFYRAVREGGRPYSVAGRRGPPGGRGRLCRRTVGAHRAAGVHPRHGSRLHSPTDMMKGHG